MQEYIEIASDLYLNFYIWLFSKLISQLNAAFKFIINVIRLIYFKLKVDNYQFTIDHPYYKEKHKIIESFYNNEVVRMGKTINSKKKNYLY